VKFRAGLVNQRGNWYTTPSSSSVQTTFDQGPGALSSSPSKNWNFEMQLDQAIGSKQVITGGLVYKTGWSATKEYDLSNWKETDVKTQLSFQSGGREDRARQVAALMHDSLSELRRRVAAIPAGTQPKVVWLWGKPTTICGNQGVVSELIKVAGGKNLGGNFDSFNRELSMETMVALNPEVVLIWGSAAYGPADLLQDPKWQVVQAVKDQRVFKATRASTWSPRVVILAWWMAHCFYPQVISQEEVERAADRFYRSCFGISYGGAR